jgi:plastocyanin
MKRLVLTMMILAAAILTGCSGDEEQADGSPQEVTVRAESIKFEPAQIEVSAGRPVELTLQNEDTLEHDFSVMEIPLAGEAEEHEEDVHDMGAIDPELHVAAAAQSTNSVEFTPAAPGRYEYFCTVVGHKEAGMVGTLVVSES